MAASVPSTRSAANGDVDGSVVVHIDQHRPGGALANRGEDQGKRRNGISLVHQARIGGEGQVPDAGPVGPTLERGRRIGTVTGHQHVEAMVSKLDGHHLRCCHTSYVCGVGKHLGQVVEPEHLAGPGEVAELQLEIGERAPRFRPGDVPAEGAPPDLSTPPTVQGGDQTDGSEPEEACADGDRSDVVSVSSRSGWPGLVGSV